MSIFISMDPSYNVRLSYTGVFFTTISKWFSNPSVVFFNVWCGFSLKTVLLGKTRACSESVLFIYSSLWFGLLSRHLLFGTRITRTCIFHIKEKQSITAVHIKVLEFFTAVFVPRFIAHPINMKRGYRVIKCCTLEALTDLQASSIGVKQTQG